MNKHEANNAGESTEMWLHNTIDGDFVLREIKIKKSLNWEPWYEAPSSLRANTGPFAYVPELL
jgi:hypothetical protein